MFAWLRALAGKDDITPSAKTIPKTTPAVTEEKENKTEDKIDEIVRKVFYPRELIILYGELGKIIRLKETSTFGLIAKTLFSLETDLMSAKKAQAAIEKCFEQYELNTLVIEHAARESAKKAGQNTFTPSELTDTNKIHKSTYNAMIAINKIYNEMPSDILKLGSAVSPLLLEAITHYNIILRVKKFPNLDSLTPISTKYTSVIQM